MDWLLSALPVVALFALRLGVPIVVTLVIGYLLSRLDAKWQAEDLAQRERAREESALPAALPCWEVKHCDPAARESCPGYLAHASTPCWQAFRQATGRVPERCFECEVFLSA